MKNIFENQKKKALLTIFSGVLLLLTVVAGSGLITVQYETTESVSLMGIGGDSIIDRVRLQYNVTQAAYSNKRITFLERFDDSSLRAPNDDWTYYETGVDTANSYPWIGASKLVFANEGNGSAYTKTQYSIPTSKAKSGIHYNSDGTIVSARAGVINGTPVGGLELTTGTYYIRVFFDGSNNIDITYHAASTGTLTTVADYVDTITADKWYTFQIELYSATALIRVYNESGGQLGVTETLSTYMTYGTMSNMTLWSNSTINGPGKEMIAFDWVYATPRYSSVTYDQSDILPDTKDNAPLSKETANIKISYDKAGIVNGSGSSQARLVYNFTTEEPGGFDSQLSYNRTELQEALATMEEDEYDVSSTQRVFAKGWSDIREDMEDSLEARIERITGSNAELVDYIILDLNCTTIYSDKYVTAVEKWYKDEGVDIILKEDPDAVVTRKNGDVESAATVPRAELGAFLFSNYFDSAALSLDPRTWGKSGKSAIDEIKFSSTDKALDAFKGLSKQFRNEISAMGGIIKGSVNDIISSSKNIIQQTKGEIKDHVDSYVVAPMMGISAKISSGVSMIKAQLSYVSNTLRNAVNGAATSIKSSIRALTDTLPAAIQNVIGTTFEGIKSTFMSAGKALGGTGLSVFGTLKDIVNTVMKYLPWILIIFVIAIVVYVVYMSKKGEALENIADDIIPGT